MKVMPVNLSQSMCTPSFKAGNTSLYFDFDGTYMPFAHREVCDNGGLTNNKEKTDAFNRLYGNIAHLRQKAKGHMNLTVTTGRSKPEYDFFIKNIEGQNLKFSYPQRLLTRNGCNAYVNDGQKFVPDTARVREISRLSGWNADLIERDFKNMLKSKGALVIDAPVNNNINEYKDMSLEYKLQNINNPNKHNYASFAQKEDCSMEIALSKELNIEKFRSKFEEYFRKNNIKAKIHADAPSSMTYLPVYNGNNYRLDRANILFISPVVNDVKLTKLYDVRNEVRKNIKDKTNDVVITAGDGSNDEDMLNPLNYLDLMGVSADKRASVKDIINDPQVCDALKSLPMMFLVVGDSQSLEHLREMGRALDKKGIHKIIAVNNPQRLLSAKIKEAMYSYCKMNEAYKSAMDSSLLDNIMLGGFSR